MTTEEKLETLSRAKSFFRDRICSNHKKKVIKAKKLSEYNINPFLVKYISNFYSGDSTPESIARAIFLPRVLGTSIATIFGNNLQYFCKDVLQGFASVGTGIDIEFTDMIDGRRKYCQLKAGPNTINKDDVKTIIDHFDALRHLARTNQLTNFNADTDCIVGVFYGTPSDLSTHYRKINVRFPVFCGVDFWERLTGDPSFYNDLANAFSEVAEEFDGRELIEDCVRDLTRQIEESDLLL